MKSREHVTNNGRAVFYASMWNDLRQAALDKGWALGLHGSLNADMDIMAMPWVEGASSEQQMIIALRNCFSECRSIHIQKHDDLPNNRRVYTMSIFADFYLDINIIKANDSHNKKENSKF